jgi:hypothetical protein
MASSRVDKAIRLARTTHSWGFLFGLVNEPIGDLHSLRIGKGSIGRNHVSEMPVYVNLNQYRDFTNSDHGLWCCNASANTVLYKIAEVFAVSCMEWLRALHQTEC